MNSEEVSRVLHTLRINYPQSYTSFTKADSAELVKLWTIEFKNDSAEQVMRAVQKYISESTERFAPNVGIIKRIMAEMNAPQIDEGEMWQAVKKYIRFMDHDYDMDMARYKELPEPVKACYSYGDLKGLSQRNSVDNDTYERPRFSKMLKDYKYNQVTQSISSGIQGQKQLEARKEIAHE